MKRGFRIISVVLILLLLLSTVPVTAFAAKKPTITVDTVEAKTGETVTINVSISGNTGIAGALIGISYDSKLTLVSAENGDAFGNLSFTKPGKLGNPAKFLWDSESGASKKNGTVLKLTFKVADNAEKGIVLKVNASCKSGDFYDSDMDTVEVNSVNGGVNIAKEAENEASVFDTVIASIKNVIAIIIQFFRIIFGR